MSTAPPPAAGRLLLRYAAMSDLGRHRKDNQDSGFASEHLLVIADGVGGAAYGDVASSTAVHVLRRLDAPPPADMLEALAGAFHRTHDRLAELVEQDAELEGTSTTITAALFDGQKLAVAHAGDSRAYLLRDGRASQLTKDHTFVQSLVDEGRITEEESRTHPHRNIILRAVDGVHDTEPDLFLVDLQPGDRVLLCSDGCSGVLSDERLGELLGSGTVDYAAVELVRAAIDAGTTDNVTVVVAEVVDAERAADEEDVELASSATGPMLVGAAASQPRRSSGSGRGFFRHRSSDTGELEPVPGGGASAEPPDPEELRYAPRPPRRFVWLRRLALLAVLLLVAAGAAKVGYDWTQRQYYVSSDGGNVAIFRGVQAEVPGMDLSSVEEVSDLPLSALPEFRAEAVRSGIAAESLESARETVRRLHEVAVVCPTPKPRARKPAGTDGPASPSPSPGGTAGRSGAASPDQTLAPSTPTPGRSPRPTTTTGPSPSPEEETVEPPDCIPASSVEAAGATGSAS